MLMVIIIMVKIMIIMTSTKTIAETTHNKSNHNDQKTK